MASLRITSGPRAGTTVELDEHELVIGREDCDLEIEDLEMSRRHAVLRRVSRRLEIEDLGSRNGTFVNGDRINEPTAVGGGAEIRVGTTVMMVEGVLPLSQTATAVAANPAPAPAQPSTPAPDAQPGGPVTVAVVGEFRPPEQRPQARGLASRSWIPVVLSFGTALVTAVLLVLYFALRTPPH